MSRLIGILSLLLLSLSAWSTSPALAKSEPGVKAKLYKIIARKLNISQADAPVFNSSQKLQHGGGFCQLTLVWRNISCESIYKFHLKDFDAKNIGVRMSNIYPRVFLRAEADAKPVKYHKKCNHGRTVNENRPEVAIDLQRPGGMEVYKIKAAFTRLIEHCREQ
jgi:hypothetical protein